MTDDPKQTTAWPRLPGVPENPEREGWHRLTNGEREWDEWWSPFLDPEPDNPDRDEAAASMGLWYLDDSAFADCPDPPRKNAGFGYLGPSDGSKPI